ncbi:MAG: tRNA (adenosine(37)-N6)-threonylcarbamoyltransferase complex ATPase subunit type 1 TsaE, partial [Caldilinea sp.]
MLVIEARSPRETDAIGEQSGRLVQGGEVLALCGELGAGNTTLVQGIAAGMGVRVRVTSPTFVLNNEYVADNGR